MRGVATHEASTCEVEIDLLDPILTQSDFRVDKHCNSICIEKAGKLCRKLPVGVDVRVTDENLRHRSGL
jgi:hypothetical protein